MGERNGDRSSILYGARTPPGNEQDERTPLVIDLTIEDDDDDSGLGHSDTLIVGDPVSVSYTHLTLPTILRV